MAFHNGMFFSTFDRDNDGNPYYNCAYFRLGGWWYNSCHKSNLNGEYGNTDNSNGINWYHWKGFTYSMKEVRMMVRKPWPEMNYVLEHWTIIVCRRHVLLSLNKHLEENEVPVYRYIMFAAYILWGIGIWYGRLYRYI